MNKHVIAVLFGGKAPEHEVSIITGIQVLHALDKKKYNVVPIYIAKDGRWILGDHSFYKPETFRDLSKAVKNKKEVIPVENGQGTFITDVPTDFILLKSFFRKKIDVFFPAFHGRYGEDGAVQGLFEMMNAAYVGCDVQASSIGMDKVVSKKIARSLGIPVLKDVWLTKNRWVKNSTSIPGEIIKEIPFPMFVKPARLGSSIGVARVNNRKGLKEALDAAFFYDTKVMVEEGLADAKEINISILGNNPYQISACEQPISSSTVLTYEDKYVSKDGASKGMASAKRIVPAPIKKATENKIRDYGQAFFSEIGGQGISRIDFLVSKDEKRIYFNEINTMPGSVAFYLWKQAGVNFHKLVDRLIDLAIERQKEKLKLITSFQSNILENFQGAKTAKL